MTLFILKDQRNYSNLVIVVILSAIFSTSPSQTMDMKASRASLLTNPVILFTSSSEISNVATGVSSYTLPEFVSYFCLVSSAFFAYTGVSLRLSLLFPMAPQDSLPWTSKPYPFCINSLMRDMYSSLPISLSCCEPFLIKATSRAGPMSSICSLESFWKPVFANTMPTLTTLAKKSDLEVPQW